ncbi:hypothetical protein SOV_51040 [Sporomusa ovata DSM 2662]|uniref:Uncharacterized protein n=1 Tax=Sporomusa ovata TaxID=2378 RepID=A0A0U1L0W5_9FIRM|nr:hypothetical protein [Sporomusa ovata]EQB27477.1 hypothetical protein SOV_2c03730 [Sporomusa ovata DSM 2662]CQR73320.1 hypothetical protein SpAn4DRAFT_2552 [Sporomusa ovata]
MPDILEIIIPENAGLQEYRYLLSLAENEITKLTPIISKYKVNRTNAKAVYDDALSSAKVMAMEVYGLKANHQTMINAKANSDPGVKQLKQAYIDAKALEIKAVDRLEQIKGLRDTLKAMVKSEHVSY